MDAWLRNFGNNIAQAGATIHTSLDTFGQNAGRALDAWGKDVGQHLDPNHPVRLAMEVTGSASFFAAEQTSRALGAAGRQTERCVTEAYNWCVTQVPWEQLAHEVQVAIQNKAEELHVVAAAQTVFRVTKEVPGEIQDWIEKHPHQTVFMVLAGAVFFAPGLITVPMLASLGFTAEGVVGGELASFSILFSVGVVVGETRKLIQCEGSAAAVMQSMIGPVQTRSIFALLQSTAAGGSGAAVVNGLATATAGVAIVAAAAAAN
ncbi:hypothetical protein yc1106_03939 [Curvularia clavata]|uniref:Uncharacterized protein n=1 Tax=Curvularia clavata TaxID=95742 RepID=A0A9Q8Z6N7_CURCL|nr:hypothetical protein yc1106_03939 [Curvularia clavata]